MMATGRYFAARDYDNIIQAMTAFGDEELERAAQALDLRSIEWLARVTTYREAGNNGPYLGEPSYSNAARIVRQVKDAA